MINNSINMKRKFDFLSGTLSSNKKILSDALNDLVKGFKESNSFIGKRIVEAEKKGIEYREFSNYESFKIETEKEGIIIVDVEDSTGKYEEIGLGIKMQYLNSKAGVEVPENLLIRLKTFDLPLNKMNLKNLGRIVDNYNLTNEKIEKFEKGNLVGINRKNVEDCLVEIVNLSLEDEEKIKNIYSIYAENSMTESLFS